MDPRWNMLIISMGHSEHPTGGDDHLRKLSHKYISQISNPITFRLADLAKNNYARQATRGTNCN
jgi:hypothetical protein